MKLRILLSYHYYKNVDLDKMFERYFTPPYPDVFADSGAFSAMTQGTPIEIDEYATWIKRYQHLFNVYSNLDVIKNAEATFQNQQYLEDRHGLTPLPVFHVLEDWSWLETYLKTYPYIGLGVAGMQSRQGAVMSWLTRCFQMAGSSAVFHGFGLTGWQIIFSFRWYSVDSSSWGKGFRFGKVPLFDEAKGRFIDIKLGDYRGWHKHAGLVRALGFNPLDFADRDRNNRVKVCAISAISYMKAEQWLRKQHGEVLIPNQKDTTAGLRLYLVSGAPARFGEAVTGAGIRLHLADTSNGINFRDADAGLKVYLQDSSSANKLDVGEVNHYLKTHCPQN